MINLKMGYKYNLKDMADNECSETPYFNSKVNTHYLTKTAFNSIILTFRSEKVNKVLSLAFENFKLKLN
jgi:hypothetical protein